MEGFGRHAIRRQPVIALKTPDGIGGARAHKAVGRPRFVSSFRQFSARWMRFSVRISERSLSVIGVPSMFLVMKYRFSPRSLFMKNPVVRPS